MSHAAPPEGLLIRASGWAAALTQVPELLHSTRELHPGRQHREGLTQTLMSISCCLRIPIKLIFNPNECLSVSLLLGYSLL